MSLIVKQCVLAHGPEWHALIDMNYIGSIILGMHNRPSVTGLLESWESVFRQGLLTFWTFVVLDREASDVTMIRHGVERMSGGTYRPSEQVLYRQLRRHADVGLVDRRQEPTRYGPPRNLFSLSELGVTVLESFAARNIRPFAAAEVQAIIERGAK